MQIPPSELIINPDGSIYHLNLRAEHIAQTIITVGDPKRVEMISERFDKIEVKKESREFVTHTGRIGSKRLSVISTGIGTDNIDIVLNELDALVNIDFETRLEKKKHTKLKFIRLGTSGGFQKDIPLDSIVISSHSLGLDGLLNFYHYENSIEEKAIKEDFEAYLEQLIHIHFTPYLFSASDLLLPIIDKGDFYKGITLTCPGFYAPQGRKLRVGGSINASILQQLAQFSSNHHRLTNFEMETAGIYGLARILGHEALSCSAILANRVENTFSKNPQKAVIHLIDTILERIIAIED